MKQSMNNSTKAIVMFCVVAAMVIMVAMASTPKSRAFFNRVARSDIYDNVSSECQVNLWEKGATVILPFTPTFTNEYVVAIIFKANAPPFFFKPRGRYSISYYQENHIVAEQVYINTKANSSDQHGEARVIVLGSCILPQTWSSSSCKVVVTALDPDPQLEEYKDSLRIVVRGSPYW
jgi:hypothetical protein